MNVHKKKCWDIPASQVTPEHLLESRRNFLKKGALLAPALMGTLSALHAMPLKSVPNEAYQNGKNFKPTDEKYARSYTNFYEFGTGKEKDEDVFRSFKTTPWKVVCDGLVENPLTLDAEELQALFMQEQRVYRLRCVEAWSAVIPWDGYPLRKLIEKVRPKKEAKYLRFETFNNPSFSPGQRNMHSYPWPYVEGLRMDEAMNDLSLLTFGMYGKPLSKANGAPIRIVVPWKYGFKSIKSIVRIEFTDKQPQSMWQKLAPKEYGFYANVNPNVDHPRWSQKTERPIGSLLYALFAKQKTLMFNGYAEQVADLYKGMDLAKYY